MKRGALEIKMEVLEKLAAYRNLKKTRLMQLANLSHGSAMPIFNLLEKKGLIISEHPSETRTVYRLTRKGRETLSLCLQIRRAMEA